MAIIYLPGVIVARPIALVAKGGKVAARTPAQPGLDRPQAPAHRIKSFFHAFFQKSAAYTNGHKK
jgi:hypothetical protein